MTLKATTSIASSKLTRRVKSLSGKRPLLSRAWRTRLASTALMAHLFVGGLTGAGNAPLDTASPSSHARVMEPPAVVRQVSSLSPSSSSSSYSSVVETAASSSASQASGAATATVTTAAARAGLKSPSRRQSSTTRRPVAAVLPSSSSSSGSRAARSPSSSGRRGLPSANRRDNARKHRQARVAAANVPTAAASLDSHARKNIYSEIAEDAAEAISELQHELQGSRKDVLILLLATACVVPVFKQLDLSPILGFLLTGCAFGPLGFSFVSDIKTIETLAEFGIVFFLFEMGLELSLERLVSMRRDVFGLGFAQMASSVVGLAMLSHKFLPGGSSSAASIVVGAGLALSSSAFALQILKDKDDMNSRHGRAAFGVLLFQDLAVVPILVAIPLLAGGGASMAVAIRQSLIKSAIALTSIAFIGRFVLDNIFRVVAKSKSHEAFLSLILLTVVGMSILTEGLGLSNTLGAFLAGVLLSETKYKYQVEADIVPFRGLLLGLFFVTVGFSIDCALLLAEWPKVMAIVAGLLAFKAGTVTLLCRYVFKLSTSQGIQAGMLVSQGGEFAFVIFRMAQTLGILTPYQGKLLMTSTAITMAATPALADVGRYIGETLEKRSGFSHYVGSDVEADEIKQDKGLVVVCGYGRIGKVVCEVLDQKFIRYIAFEVNPAKAIEARNRGLPVFFGDVSRPEVLQNFNVGNAKMVVCAMGDRQTTNRAIVSLKRLYPDLPILARAVDADHRSRLQKTLGVMAMVPTIPENSMLFNLPFGGTVLKSLGYEAQEVDGILEAIRKKAIEEGEAGFVDVTPDDEEEPIEATLAKAIEDHDQEVAAKRVFDVVGDSGSDVVDGKGYMTSKSKAKGKDGLGPAAATATAAVGVAGATGDLAASAISAAAELGDAGGSSSDAGVEAGAVDAASDSGTSQF